MHGGGVTLRRIALAFAFLATACTADLGDPVDSAPLENDAVTTGSTSGSGGAATVAASSTSSTGGSGTGGDASGGAGGTASASLSCYGSTALLCDDFESGDVDSSVWSIIEQSGGSVAVSGDVVREGQFAMRVTLPSADGARGFLRADDSLFPLPNNEMYGRVFVHVGPESPRTHSKMLMLRGDLPSESAQYRLDINGGDFNSRYTTPSINNDVQHGGLRKFGYEVPDAQWLCVEWHYDGANHEMRYWFDGAAMDDMTVTTGEDPQWTAPTFDRFEIGWQTFQAASQSSYDIYFDALAIDTTRIGCGP